MKILAIETSCDETAISILEADGDKGDIKIKILANNLISQINLHKKYGGVFPALAKREHSKNLIPLLAKSLKESHLGSPTSKSAWKLDFQIQGQIEKILEREPELLKQFLDYIPTIAVPDIDTIAVTQGPGLEPALWVGINFAKALSLVWNKPLLPVNHMEGHLLASLVNPKSKIANSKIHKVNFPAISLLISGGHSELILIKDWLRYEKIGQTKDDAVGEAFDKVARMLNLPYPGGPEISKLAEIERKKPLGSRSTKWGEIEIKLPRPMLRTADFDFSFSGLKTAVLYLVKNLLKQETKHKRQDTKIDLPMAIKQKIALEFENAVTEILLKKTQTALEKYGAQTLILGGGVIANHHLRQTFQSLGSRSTKLEILMPELEFATDNAVMIGIAGYLRFLANPPKKQKNSGRLPSAIARLNELKADGNLELF